MGYFAVLLRYPRVIAFGFLCGASSSFGQTFFISFFVPQVTTTFGIDRTFFSSIFAGCTIASAVVMPWAGRQIDRFPLRSYTLIAQVALGLGLAGVALSQSVLALALSLFLVRFCGQGLMKHTAVTSTSRYFSKSRGKAIALVALGQPAGEAVLPMLAIFIIANWGWREAIFGSAAFVIVIVVPAGFLLLAGQDTRPAHFFAKDDVVDQKEKGHAHVAKSWTRRELFTRPAFLLLLPFWVAPAFVLTGLFFHQLSLGEEMGWTADLVAESFVAYAISASTSSMIAGPLIDRFGPRKLVPWMLLPLTLAVLLLMTSHGAATAPTYLALAGACVGMAGIRSAWLAERFGTEHLGAIRSGLMAFGVFSTAASPPLFGFLLDAGLPFREILNLLFGGLVITHVLCALALRALDRHPR